MSIWRVRLVVGGQYTVGKSLGGLVCDGLALGAALIQGGCGTFSVGVKG